MKRRTQQQLLDLGRTAVRLIGDVLGQRQRADTHEDGGRARFPPQQPRGGTRPPRDMVATTTGRAQVAYAPVADGDADPGEVVWTWVPYEDDPAQGKDRPVVVIGHLGGDVAALQLTSRGHDDRHHHALGSGSWDHEGRSSWVKLDRVLQLDPDGIRREGAVLDRPRFDSVVAAWEAYNG